MIRSIAAAVCGFTRGLRRLAYVCALGGPVGVFYTLRLERIRRRQAAVCVYITREKELNREHLAALNHELTQLIAQQQATSVAAAQFWNWCEKKAGVQP